MTFYSSDYMHWSFFNSIAKNAMKFQLIPCLIGSKSIERAPWEFSKFSCVNGINPLFVIRPQIHIQMQDCDSMHRELMTTSKKLGALSIVLQHGISGNAPQYQTSGECDFYFAWSKTESENVGKIIGKDKIIVTGNPRYDTYRRRVIESIDYVMLATSPITCTNGEIDGRDEKTVKNWIDKFLKLTKEFPDKKFYIKTHPSPLDEPNFYIEYIKSTGIHCPNLKLTNNTMDISVFFGEIDCLISFPTSSSMADAATCGIPIINIEETDDLGEEIKRIENGEVPSSYQYDDISIKRISGEVIAKVIQKLINRENINSIREFTERVL